MYIVMAQVGDGGNNRSFPVCQITVQDPRTGMSRLKQLLADNGINTELYAGGNFLKWEDVLFSIRDVPAESGLSQMVKAVRIWQKREDESKQRFAEFLGADH